MSKKWTVVWQQTEGEGREVEVDTEKQARALAVQVAAEGWKPQVYAPGTFPPEAAKEPEPSQAEPADEVIGPPEPPAPEPEPAPKPKKRKR